MNAKRREKLTEIRDRLNEYQSDLVTLHDQEQDYLDNMPESFRNSAKGEEVETVVEHLNAAVCSIDEAVEAIDGIAGV